MDPRARRITPLSKEMGPGKVNIPPPSSSPPTSGQTKGHPQTAEGRDPTGFEADQSGGSPNKSQLGFPKFSPQPNEPPSSSASELRTATGPRGRSCDAHWFPTFRSSPSPQPPAKGLGKGQVCKGEDTKSWGSHKDAATPTKMNLSLVGRTPAPAAAPGASVGSAGRGGRGRGPAGGGQRSPPLRSPPGTRAPRHLSPAWGPAPRSRPAPGR